MPEDVVVEGWVRITITWDFVYLWAISLMVGGHDCPAEVYFVTSLMRHFASLFQYFLFMAIIVTIY